MMMTSSPASARATYSLKWVLISKSPTAFIGTPELADSTRFYQRPRLRRPIVDASVPSADAARPTQATQAPMRRVLQVDRQLAFRLEVMAAEYLQVSRQHLRRVRLSGQVQAQGSHLGGAKVVAAIGAAQPVG